MKCNASHAPGECQTTEVANFVCVNCGGGHSTNFSGCPKRSAKVSARASSRAVRSSRSAQQDLRAGDFPVMRSRPLSQPVTTNISYANAVSGIINNGAPAGPTSNSSLPNNSGSPFSFLQSEANALFGCSITVLLGKVRNFLPYYNNMNDITEKKMALLNFLFDMVSNG